MGPNFKFSPIGLLFLTLVYIGFPTLLLAQQQQQQQQQQQKCIINLKDVSKVRPTMHTICNYRMLPYTKNSVKLFLRDCRGSEENHSTNTTMTCRSVIESRQVCFITIEISTLHQHEKLLPNFNDQNKCTENDLHFNLTITSTNGSPNEKQIDDWKLFEDIRAFEIRHVKYLNIQLKNSESLKKLIYMNKMVENIQILNMNAKYSMIPFRLFDSNEFKKLRRIYIKDSNFAGIGIEAFYITQNGVIESIELENVELHDNIQSEGIKLFCTKLSEFDSILVSDPEYKLTFKINQSKLKKSIEKNVDFLSINGCSMENQLKLELILTGNSDDYLLEEKVFKKILDKLYSNNSIGRFKFDNIECCSDKHKWLFEFYAANHDKNTEFKLDIDCLDLSGNVRDYYNFTKLTDVCKSRNVYPVLTIAIVLLFLLAIILGLFTFVCFYYILPKKAQPIMIKKGNLSSSAETTSAFKTSKTVGNSSILELKSTQTDSNMSKQPLLSMAESKSANQKDGEHDKFALPKVKSPSNTSNVKSPGGVNKITKHSRSPTSASSPTSKLPKSPSSTKANKNSPKSPQSGSNQSTTGKKPSPSKSSKTKLNKSARSNLSKELQTKAPSNGEREKERT